MVDFNSFLEWPRGVARLGVVLCIALTAAYGSVYFVKAVDRLWDDAARNAATNFDDREFAGGDARLVNKDALYETRARIPGNEAYRVVAGPGVLGMTEINEQYIVQYVRSFLMPRRPSADARWILCYVCDVASLGDGFEVVWRSEDGILLGRLPS